MMELVSGLIKAIMYLLFLGMLLQLKKRELCVWKDFMTLGILTMVQFAFTPEKHIFMNSILPIIVMIVLGIYIYTRYSIKNIKVIIALVIETHVIFVFCGFLIGCLCGVYEFVVEKYYGIGHKISVMIVMRIIVMVLLCWKYEWFQKHLQHFAKYIMVIIGSFLLILQQLFYIGIGNKDILYLEILLLLVYMVMFFTVLMNLQHRHLTADNQRILDDNQRMSQEIHRSRDVIDVVSRVVATEDTIDPKLRQELADFCKSEKQEMFDPDLAASLIGDTGMDLLNALLRDKLCQCRQQEISFEVMIPGPIDTYVNEIGIGEAELLRVINDLVKNAVTAINKTDSEVREILLILAVGPADCLELCVYDSGVPFPDFILERFGERGNTTTGTGNGLADTANTLRTYDASIEIKAIEPGTDIYTKCVRICFDGKNEIHV